MKEFKVKTNWLLSELQVALGDEAISKLTEFHRAKVSEREAKRTAARPQKVSVDQVRDLLGAEAAMELVNKMAATAAAAASTTILATSSHESAPASPSKGSRGRK